MKNEATEGVGGGFGGGMEYHCLNKFETLNLTIIV